jgi:hypothetical protein
MSRVLDVRRRLIAICPVKSDALRRVVLSDGTWPLPAGTGVGIGCALVAQDSVELGLCRRKRLNQGASELSWACRRAASKMVNGGPSFRAVKGACVVGIRDLGHGNGTPVVGCAQQGRE